MAGRKSRPPMPPMGALAAPGAATASGWVMGRRDRPGDEVRGGVFHLGRSMFRLKCLDVLDHDSAHLIGHVLEAVHHFFEVAIDIDADDEIHGVAAAMLQIERLAALVV